MSGMLLLTPRAPLSEEQKWKVTPELTHGLLEDSGAAKRGRSREPSTTEQGAGIASPGTYSSFQGLFHVRKRARALETWKKRQLPVLLDNKSGVGLPWLVPKWLPFFRALVFLFCFFLFFP